MISVDPVPEEDVIANAKRAAGKVAELLSTGLSTGGEDALLGQTICDALDELAKVQQVRSLISSYQCQCRKMLMCL